MDTSDRPGRHERARAALEYYVETSGIFVPRADGERDTKLDAVLDRLAQDLVDLSGWFSEGAQWMERLEHPHPPAWAEAVLAKAAREGRGPQGSDAPAPEPSAPGRRGRKTERPAGINPACLEYLAEHYDELPRIDPATGRPAGEI